MIKGISKDNCQRIYFDGVLAKDGKEVVTQLVQNQEYSENICETVRGSSMVLVETTVIINGGKDESIVNEFYTNDVPE